MLFLLTNILNYSIRVKLFFIKARGRDVRWLAKRSEAKPQGERFEPRELHKLGPNKSKPLGTLVRVEDLERRWPIPDCGSKSL